MGRDHEGGGNDQSDQELLAAWRAGDRKSGERLWRRHTQSVQRFFRNKAPWSVAMDLGQRTWLECQRSRGEIRCFRSYILGIAIHQLFDYLRAEKRKQRRTADFESLSVEETVAASPEEWVGAKREKRVLLRALRRLPVTQQLVLELRYWERLSDRDIAEVLAWPAGTVKSRITAGKRGLRIQMRRLETSPDQALSTIDTFEQWASRTRNMIGEGSPATGSLDEAADRDPPVPQGIELAEGSVSIELPAERDDDEDPSRGR